MGRESRKRKPAGQGATAGGSGAGGGQGGSIAPPDRRALEKTMSDLYRLLAQQDFAGVDEANRFLQDLVTKGAPIPGGSAGTALEEAQDLVYEAWDATGARRSRLDRKALEISPDCADAYVLLAEETARTVEEARDLFAQGVAAGERALDPEFFENKAVAYAADALGNWQRTPGALTWLAGAR